MSPSASPWVSVRSSAFSSLAGAPAKRTNESFCHSVEKIMSRSGAWSRLPLQTLAGIGCFAHAQWDELRHAAAVIGTVFSTGVQPRFWTRPVRTALARQVLAIGVEPLWFVGAVAVFVGISVVVQLAFWVGEAGQSQLLGP